MTLLLEGKNAGCLGSFGSVARHDDSAYDAYDAYDDDTILSLIGFDSVVYIQAFCRILADRVRVSVL